MLLLYRTDHNGSKFMIPSLLTFSIKYIWYFESILGIKLAYTSFIDYFLLKRILSTFNFRLFLLTGYKPFDTKIMRLRACNLSQ